MKLIVGLGNPGFGYKNNRHNVGYMFVEYLAASQYEESKLKSQNDNSKFEMDQKIKSTIVQLTINNEKVILIKPQTFMNQSGQAVQSCVTRYKLQVTTNLYVVHDDLDIPLGQCKMQKGVGPKLHNGVLSVEQALGTTDFWRVRIGVDNRRSDRRIAGEAYVLQDFLLVEKDKLREVFANLARALFI